MDRELETYSVIPMLDGVVSCAFDCLDGSICYEADEAFDCCAIIGAAFCAVGKSHDRVVVCCGKLTIVAEKVDKAEVGVADTHEEDLRCLRDPTSSSKRAPFMSKAALLTRGNYPRCMMPSLVSGKLVWWSCLISHTPLRARICQYRTNVL